MTAVTPASPAAGNPGRPPRKQYVKNFWKYRFLLRELVNKNIKLQYRNSVLGVFAAAAHDDRAQPRVWPNFRP